MRKTAQQMADTIAERRGAGLIQHCGKLGDHDRHEHMARARKRVTACTCDARVCQCPGEPSAGPARLQVFICTGELLKEGAPSHLPVRVGM